MKGLYITITGLIIGFAVVLFLLAAINQTAKKNADFVIVYKIDGDKVGSYLNNMQRTKNGWRGRHENGDSVFIYINEK